MFQTISFETFLSGARVVQVNVSLIYIYKYISCFVCVMYDVCCCIIMIFVMIFVIILQNCTI